MSWSLQLFLDLHVLTTSTYFEAAITSNCHISFETPGILTVITPLLLFMTQQLNIAAVRGELTFQTLLLRRQFYLPLSVHTPCHRRGSQVEFYGKYKG